MREGRPPVAGYGTKSRRLKTTIRLQEAICEWVEDKLSPAAWIRQVINREYEQREEPSPDEE